MASRASRIPGLAPGAELVRMDRFEGVNQRDARMAIGDQEFFWCENLFPLGPGNLRSMWGVGAPLWTVPPGKTLIYASQFNLGTTSYWAMFLNDGSAYQVDLFGNAVQIGINEGLVGNWPGFFTGGTLPATAQWGSQYLIIIANITAGDTGFFQGLFIWDGAHLYGNFFITAQSQTKYGNSPFTVLQDQGGDYTSVPTISADPVFGSGAIGVATLTGSKVTKITINSSQQVFSTNATAPGVPPFIPLIFKGGGQGNAAWGTPVVNTQGQVTGITLGSGGSGYFDVPQVNVLGVGVGATCNAVLNGTTIAAIDIDNAGAGYTSVPAVTITAGTPGSGSGATATAIVHNGQVVRINVTNSGTGYTSKPLVTIAAAPAGGTTATAHAVLTATTVASILVTNLGNGYDPNTTTVQFQGGNGSAAALLYSMPTGVKGTGCESFLNRLWIIDGTNLYISAPGNAVDFAAADGGLITPSSDPDLRQRYTAIKQINGFIYLYGDSSVAVISQIQTGPPTTVQISDIDAQTGGIFRDSVYAVGRAIVSVGPYGVSSIYGGTATKISDKLDKIFENANFVTTVPCAGVAIVFGVTCYFALINSLDPTTNTQRTFLICWDGKRWYFASQENNLTFITTQEINSQITLWGTDGTNFFQLFAQKSPTLLKRVVSKLWSGESPGTIKRMSLFTGLADPTPQGIPSAMDIQIFIDSYDNASEQLPFDLTNYVFWTNAQLQIVTFTNVVNQEVNWFGSSHGFEVITSNQAGRMLGLTLKSLSRDFSIVMGELVYTEDSYVANNP